MLVQCSPGCDIRRALDASVDLDRMNAFDLHMDICTELGMASQMISRQGPDQAERTTEYRQFAEALRFVCHQIFEDNFFSPDDPFLTIC